MSSLFKAFGQNRFFPVGYAERISGLIPEALKNLPCFLDRLTGIWRYEFGTPLTLHTGRAIVGTPMFPEVELLFDVLGCSAWRLSTEKLHVYLARLTDPTRHEDVLVEFAPILRLLDSVAVKHEVSGSEDSAATVDRSIEAPGYPTLLLEVKNRIWDLIESFETIANLDTYEKAHRRSTIMRSSSEACSTSLSLADRRRQSRERGSRQG